MKNINEIAEDLIEKYAQTPAADATVDPNKLTNENRLAIIRVLEQANELYASIFEVLEGTQPQKIFNSNKANDLYLNLKADKAVLTNEQAKYFLNALNTGLNNLADKTNSTKQAIQQVKFTP